LQIQLHLSFQKVFCLTKLGKKIVMATEIAKVRVENVKIKWRWF